MGRRKTPQAAYVARVDEDEQDCVFDVFVPCACESIAFAASVLDRLGR